MSRWTGPEHDPWVEDFDDGSDIDDFDDAPTVSTGTLCRFCGHEGHDADTCINRPFDDARTV